LTTVDLHGATDADLLAVALTGGDTQSLVTNTVEHACTELAVIEAALPDDDDICRDAAAALYLVERRLRVALELARRAAVKPRATRKGGAR
jgi:hypothetical protein